MSVYQYEHRSAEAPPDPAPRLEDIPFAVHGLDPARVSDAFELYERQLTWYRTRHGTSLPAIAGDPNGHDLRADAMRLIRAAVEFADVVERDAQEVACRQVEQAGGAIRQREYELEERESALRSELTELERRRASLILAARREAEEIVAEAMRESTEVRRETEAARVRIVEECRHHATDLANASRADVEETLEWARAQAEAIVRRGKAVAEQLIAASLRNPADVTQVVNAIVRAAEHPSGEHPRGGATALPTALPSGRDTMDDREVRRTLVEHRGSPAEPAAASRMPAAPLGATRRSAG